MTFCGFAQKYEKHRIFMRCFFYQHRLAVLSIFEAVTFRIRKNQTATQRQRLRFGKEEQGSGADGIFCKKMPEQSGLCSDVVRAKGFEPPTYWFVASHSIQLSYARIPQRGFPLDSLISIAQPP